MSIETRAFGRTGLQTTILGYGAMALNKKHVDDALASRLLNRLLDGGVNFIDTAPDYGQSEDLIGRHIAHRRDAYILATKCGCRVPGDAAHQEPAHHWSGARLMRNLESSLRRLRTDHIDVWQLHSGFPDEIRASDAVETLQQARATGKVRFIALSTKGRNEGDQGKRMLTEYVTWDVFDVLQVVYSPLARHVEDLMHDADRRGRGLIVRGLTNVTEAEWAGFERAGLDDLVPEGSTRMQFLLRLGLSHPALDTSIPGTADLAHLEQNLAAAEAGALSAELRQTALDRLTAAGLPAGG